MNVAELFNDEPAQWGLRGDPYLWQELKERFKNTAMPSSKEAVEQLLVEGYESVTGHSIDDQGGIYIERLAHGGMSSGCISAQFWKNRGIPILLERVGV